MNKNHKRLTGEIIKRIFSQGRIIWFAVILLSGLTFAVPAASDLDLENRKQSMDSLGLNSPGGLQDLLKYAVINSPSLKAAYYNWQAAVGKPDMPEQCPTRC